MRSNPLTRYLEPSDWVLIGYLIGLGLWYIFETSTAEETARSWTEQNVTLSEDHLQRLENGDSVAVSRWHGHDLVLEGSIVVDQDALEDGDGQA